MVVFLLSIFQTHQGSVLHTQNTFDAKIEILDLQASARPIFSDDFLC